MDLIEFTDINGKVLISKSKICAIWANPENRNIAKIQVESIVHNVFESVDEVIERIK